MATKKRNPAGKSRDLTAALEEYRKGKEQKLVTIFGTDFKLPQSLPASVGVRILQMQNEGVDEIPPDQVVEIGKELLGQSQWDRLMSLIHWEELDFVFSAMMAELNPVEDEDDSDGQAEAGDSGEA